MCRLWQKINLISFNDEISHPNIDRIFFMHPFMADFQRLNPKFSITEKSHEQMKKMIQRHRSPVLIALLARITLGEEIGSAFGKYFIDLPIHTRKQKNLDPCQNNCENCIFFCVSQDDFEYETADCLMHQNPNFPNDEWNNGDQSANFGITCKKKIQKHPSSHHTRIDPRTQYLIEHPISHQPSAHDLIHLMDLEHAKQKMNTRGFVEVLTCDDLYAFGSRLGEMIGETLHLSMRFSTNIKSKQEIFLEYANHPRSKANIFIRDLPKQGFENALKETIELADFHEMGIIVPSPQSRAMIEPCKILGFNEEIPIQTSLKSKKALLCLVRRNVRYV